MTNMPGLDKNVQVQFLSMRKNKTGHDVGGFESIMKVAGKSQTSRDVMLTGSDDKQSMNLNDRTKTNPVKDKLEQRTEKMNSKHSEKTVKTEKAKASDDQIKSDDLEQISEEVAEKIAELLGVPVETVMTTLQELEMNISDLLDLDSIKEIVADILDASPEMMIMDESLYQTVSDVLNAVEEMIADWMQEENITPEQFEDILNTFKDSLKDANLNVTEKEPMGQENNVPKVVVETVSEDESEQSYFDVSQGAVVKAVSSETQSAQGRQEGGEESQKDEHNDHNILTTNNGLNGQTQSMNANSFENAKAVFTNVVDAQEIMNQITEYMKVQLKPDMTSVEMQLNPESLGSVHVQISAKEGAVTAQFAAQNEEVKAVLESQLVELKQNLEEQGVKVEAVEVTIAQYSMDRNPNEQSSQSEAERAFRSQRRIRRSINLGELDELEELSTEEQIAVEMMRADGNSVDYTA